MRRILARVRERLRSDEESAAARAPQSDASSERSLRAVVVPRFVRRSYLAKFAAALVVVVLLVGSVGGYAYTVTADQLGEQARDEFTDVAARDAKSLAEWRAERTVTTRMMAKYDIMVGGDADKINAFLGEEIQRLPSDVEHIHYVNVMERRVVASTDGALVGELLMPEDAPWAYTDRTYGSDGVYVSKVYESEGNPTVAFVGQIDESPGALGNYVLVITADLGRVAQGFSHPTVGSFTQVVNANGDVVADERGIGTFSPYAGNATSTVVAAGLNGSSGFVEDAAVEAGLDADHVVAYAPVRGANWVVALHVPTARAFALKSTITTTLLSMVGVAFLGLAFIGVTLGRDTVSGLNRLGAKANALERGDLDAEFTSAREDEIGDLFRAFESMRDALRERIEESERERAAAREAQSAAERERERAEEARRETEAFARRLEAKATEFSDVMADCAAGDLTRRLDADAENDAMQAIAASFNDTIAEIERTVADVASFAGAVADASDRVTVHVDDVEEVGREVSGSVDQISDGAARQNDRLQSVAGEVDDMSATIQEVAASADEVAETSRDAATAGGDGRAAAVDAVQELHEIRAQTAETVETVAALDEQMDRIGDIVDVITSIADQTNILALNANIEAARAGDAGDGFAVVSSEVKELAAETRESAAEIAALIEDVQAQTTTSVAEMERIEARVEDGVETVEDTRVALESVVDRVEDADVGVQEISRAMDDQASSVGDVAGAVDDLAGISEETTAEAATVARAADEQASTLADVSDDAHALSEKADELRRELAAFETAAGAETADPRDGDTPGGDASDAVAVPDGNGAGREDGNGAESEVGSDGGDFEWSADSA